MEVKSVYFPTFAALTYCPYEVLQSLLQMGGSQGAAKRFSIQNDSLIFYPNASGTVQGQYVRRLPDISTGLNPFFLRHPDLFMYAALAESAPYMGEAARLPEWKERYVTIAQSVNESERRRATRGSKLQVRVG